MGMDEQLGQVSCRSLPIHRPTKTENQNDSTSKNVLIGPYACLSKVMGHPEMLLYSPYVLADPRQLLIPLITKCIDLFLNLIHTKITTDNDTALKFR